MKPSLEELVSNVHKGGRGEGLAPQAAQRASWLGLCFALGLWLLSCVIWQSRDPKGTTSVVFHCPACIFYTGIGISLVFVVPGSTPQIERGFCLPLTTFSVIHRGLSGPQNPGSRKPLLSHALHFCSSRYLCGIFQVTTLVCWAASFHQCAAIISFT